jgi:hypothetical protein
MLSDAIIAAYTVSAIGYRLSDVAGEAVPTLG